MASLAFLDGFIFPVTSRGVKGSLTWQKWYEAPFKGTNAIREDSIMT